MRIRILATQDEKEINKELEKLEKTKYIATVIPVKDGTWILHYPEDIQTKKELSEIRQELDRLKKWSEK